MAVRAWNQRERTRTLIEGESRTHQSFQAACDINAILARYEQGIPLPQSSGDGMFADVTGLQVDLTEAIERSREVRVAYEQEVMRREKETREAAAKPPASPNPPQPAPVGTPPAASSAASPPAASPAS